MGRIENPDLNDYGASLGWHGTCSARAKWRALRSARLSTLTKHLTRPTLSETRSFASYRCPNCAVVSLDVLIRSETPDDYAAVREVNLAAFGSPLEAALVERLRDDGLVIASLVAVDDAGQVVGHILFSPVRIMATKGDQMQVASLAPMSVLPSHQRRGIGSMLVEHGIEVCKRAHYHAIVLVGHPRYYPRFGFTHALVAGLKNPFAADEAFMGLELVRGALSEIEGCVVYPDEAFNQFS